MEFLNGLKAQPLELLLGNGANKQEGCSLYSTICCCYSVILSPLLLAERKLLRQRAQDTGLGQ